MKSLLAKNSKNQKKKKKLLKVKIKHQGAFRQGKLPFAENTFPPQELLGSTLKLDPLLHHPGHPHAHIPKNCVFSCACAMLYRAILKAVGRKKNNQDMFFFLFFFLFCFLKNNLNDQESILI